MSHITRLEIQITDLNALEHACVSVGVELRLQQKTFRHYANQRSACECAIVVPNNAQAFEIGLVRSPQNADAYELRTDFWMGGYGLVQQVGENAERLLQHYAAHMSVKQLMSEGYRVDMETDAEGNIFVYAEE